MTHQLQLSDGHKFAIWNPQLFQRIFGVIAPWFQSLSCQRYRVAAMVVFCLDICWPSLDDCTKDTKMTLMTHDFSSLLDLLDLIGRKALWHSAQLIIHLFKTWKQSAKWNANPFTSHQISAKSPTCCAKRTAKNKAHKRCSMFSGAATSNHSAISAQAKLKSLSLKVIIASFRKHARHLEKKAGKKNSISDNCRMRMKILPHNNSSPKKTTKS